MNGGEPSNLERVLELPVILSAQIGSSRRSIRDILALKVGAVMVLDRETCDPVALYANGKAIAQGEIVLTGQSFGLRVTTLGSGKTGLRD